MDHRVKSIMITPFDAKEVKPYLPTCLDIETSTEGELLDIGYTHDTFYTHFETWQDFTRYIELEQSCPMDKETRERLLTIYAHNGAKFDWLHYMRWLVDNEHVKDINVMMSEQMIIGIFLELKSGVKLKLCDSFRLMPYALHYIADKLNTKYKKLYTGDYISHMQDMKSDKPEEYYAYLKNDVLALQEALYNFWQMIYQKEGNIGRLPMTLPALALRVFRKYIDDPIITPWNDDIREFTRSAYTGSRVECYRPGIYTNVQVYDVNSMYPFVMSKYQVPVSAQCRWVTEYDRNSCGFYEIVYTQHNTNVPPILRDTQTNEFEYHGRGIYYTGEINLLEDMGATIKIIRGLEFTETAVLFNAFVTKYYAIRKEAQANDNAALDFTIKILLNSLYGKFGQRPVKKSLHLATNEKLTRFVRQGKKVTVKGEFLFVEEEAVIQHEFCAIAAIITAMARVELYLHIVKFGGKYIACDTDSVHTEAHEIETSNDLGGFKLEYSGEGVYLGKKLYGLYNGVIEKIRAKGIGRAVKQGALNYNSFVQLMDGTLDKLIIDFETMPTVREVLYGNKQPARMIQRRRTIRPTHNKGGNNER